MNVCFRPMEERDLDGVLLLAASSVEAPHWSRGDYEKILAFTPEAPVMAASWVAEANDLVGFAVVRWLRGEPAAEVESLVVASQWRRQGVGTALIRGCMQWACGCGASDIRLEVRTSNTGALALYRGLGFVSVALRRGYYALPPEDAIVLQARCKA